MSRTKKLSAILIILVIVTPTIAQVNISTKALEVINSYYQNETTSEIGSSYSWSDSNKQSTEFDYSILREHMLTYLFDRTTSLENRYYMSLVYSQIFADDRRDMVLALMAHELSIIYDADVFVFINTFLVYYQSDWCILLMHGNQVENRNELIEYVDNLATTFDTVILASCNSQYLTLDKPNVIGFKEEITFSKALDTINHEVGYKSELSALMDSELAYYELKVYPSGFVATSSRVVTALATMSLLDKQLFDINIAFPNFITLERGTQYWGEIHINAKDESFYFFNYHITEILTSEDTIIYRYPYTNPDMYGIIAVKKTL